MKKTTPLKLSKRLTQYSALSLAVAGLADANGQGVVYTPNVNIASNTYNLDLDGGGTFDFYLRHWLSSNHLYYS